MPMRTLKIPTTQRSFLRHLRGATRRGLAAGVRRSLILVVAGVLAWSPRPGSAQAQAVAVIDAGNPRQTIVGFGGDFGPTVMSDLSPSDRMRLLQFIVKDAGINLVRMGNVAYEGASAQNPWGANDNDDPFAINWSAFNFCTGVGGVCNDDWKVLLPALRGLGVTGEYFGNIQGPRWNGFDGRLSFNEDELVENQLALFLHFRDRLGLRVGWVAPFSEPSGGGINWRISAVQAANVVKKLGARLESSGFRDVKMLVPDATGVESSIEYARVILSDPAARRYVGAIGYHVYDTGDGGASPDGRWMSARARLRELAASYGLPLRMTELCCIGGLLQRANHIYNELEYGDSQTYFPQFIVRKVGEGGHGHEQAVTDADPGSIVVYTKDGSGRLSGISPTKYTGIAIGHYARHARPGWVRLPVTSNMPGVRAQAFVSRDAGLLGLVVINNTDASVRLQLLIRGGIQLTRVLGGEQTQEGKGPFWEPLKDARLDAGALIVSASGRSVTGFTVSIRP